MSIAVRTTPSDLIIIGHATPMTPGTAPQAIPAAWQRFLADPPAARLSAPPVEDAFYAVYCDYVADHRQAHTMVLGMAVPADCPVPPGLRRVTVPGGRFGRLAAAGSPADAVWRAWAEINERWPLRAERRYIADYERYDPGHLTAQHVEAEIVVGLR